jgi:hypothetical protein
MWGKWGGGVAGPQPMSTAVRGAQIYFGDLTLFLTYAETSLAVQSSELSGCGCAQPGKAFFEHPPPDYAAYSLIKLLNYRAHALT